MKFMLDTDMCICMIKKKPRTAVERMIRTDPALIGISAITLSELEFGIQKSSRPSQNKMALSEFLASIRIAPFDDAAALQYGFLRAHLEKRGTPIGSLDMLIAAHALALGAVLVANNEKEFARVPNLRVQNWAK